MARKAILCAIGALLVGACSTAPAVHSVSLELKPYFRDLKSTQLQVGGRTLTFLVDSAGGRTLISPEVAAASGCTPSGRDVAYRMTGEPVVFASCDSLVADASGFRVSLHPVAVFDVNALLPPELPKLDGVLALDAFRGRVVSIDWSHDRLVVHASQEADRALAVNGVPVRIATGENGSGVSALVPVAGTSRSLWFLLDSGNIRGTLVAKHIQEHGLLASAADGSVSIAVGERPSVRLVPVIADINLDGVLGTEYLKRQPIALDLRRAP